MAILRGVSQATCLRFSCRSCSMIAILNTCSATSRSLILTGLDLDPDHVAPRRVNVRRDRPDHRVGDFLRPATMPVGEVDRGLRLDVLLVQVVEGRLDPCAAPTRHALGLERTKVIEG